MDIKLIGRTLEIDKNRISVNSFKKENILIGVSYNRKIMKFKDFRDLFLYLIMPYKWLEKHFFTH